MKNIKYLIFALALVVLASCKKDPYQVYNDLARLQFGPTPNYAYIASHNLLDSTKTYSFSYGPTTTTQDTVFFDIYIMGNPSTKDRPFTLQQVQLTDGSTNALAGTDYKAFTDATVSSVYVIKAGQTHAVVPIVLLRSATLKTTTVTLEVKIAPNVNFQPGDQALIWRKVIFTDRLSQPAAWNASRTTYYLGAYSIVKHAFMIQITGQKWDDDFINTVFADYEQGIYWSSKCKMALADYNKAHPGNPMLDENGLVIVFP
jgi:hypothetical protein